MLPIEPRVSPEEIAELFAYDPDSGFITRRTSRGPICAGSLVAGDYIKINGYSYVTARVAWCLFHKEWPPIELTIDHKNRIHGDNSIDNLRLATYQQNAHNRGGRGTLPKGVYIRNRMSRPWASRIMVGGTSIELGSFRSIEEAAQAYQEACIKYHGEFACPT